MLAGIQTAARGGRRLNSSHGFASGPFTVLTSHVGIFQFRKDLSHVVVLECITVPRAPSCVPWLRPDPDPRPLRVTGQRHDTPLSDPGCERGCGGPEAAGSE